MIMFLVKSSMLSYAVQSRQDKGGGVSLAELVLNKPMLSIAIMVLQLQFLLPCRSKAFFVKQVEFLIILGQTLIKTL